MCVTKISDRKNLNLLQQVEMWLGHVYFRYMVNCACIVRHFKQDIFPVEDLAILAYTTGTTSKHQWYRNIESWYYIVAYESVHSLAGGNGAWCCDII